MKEEERKPLYNIAKKQLYQEGYSKSYLDNLSWCDRVISTLKKEGLLECFVPISDREIFAESLTPLFGEDAALLSQIPNGYWFWRVVAEIALGHSAKRAISRIRVSVPVQYFLQEIEKTGIGYLPRDRIAYGVANGYLLYDSKSQRCIINPLFVNKNEQPPPESIGLELKYRFRHKQ